jgi:hypothetical protein
MVAGPGLISMSVEPLPRTGVTTTAAITTIQAIFIANKYHGRAAFGRPFQESFGRFQAAAGEAAAGPGAVRQRLENIDDEICLLRRPSNGPYFLWARRGALGGGSEWEW